MLMTIFCTNPPNTNYNNEIKNPTIIPRTGDKVIVYDARSNASRIVVVNYVVFDYTDKQIIVNCLET